MTNYYRANGYITSRAYIPFQKIENQTAVLNILEGLPGTLSVEGSRYFSSSYYENAFKLKSNKPLNSTELEESLREINRNSHINSKLYLLAGERPGTTDIILKTEETDPVSIYYQWHNKGSSSTHHSRHVFHFDHDSFLGNGDSLRAAYILTEEGSITGGYTYYSFAAPNPDLVFRISGSYFRSLLTNHLKPSEIKGVSTAITTGASYTLHRGAASLHQADAGLEFKDSKTSLNDLKINMDRMRVATIGIRFLTEIYGLRVYGTQDTHIGIPDLLGGSQQNDLNTTRINTGGSFTYYTGALTAIQKIQRYQSVKLTASGQISNENLTSLERFRAGGSNSVRAYPESDSSGDSGYLISGEFSSPIPGLNPDLKSMLSKKPLGSTYRWMLFFDLAKTYNLERITAESEKNRLLMGAGLRL
ncbi:MAG: ShlB/FhaC/HecB family hemolysin secretion/activation protein, partial [Candidatus Omnitrophica bacterium]|nr:ShlB/FhaC/HecB family hemolysin secretion/activation protein [Candidatus Omnitrophota bacterium]